jgi:HK97 family phage major capsid protein
MNYAEQIGAFEARRKTLTDANEAIMATAAEAGATLDADQASQFDENEADISEIDKHLDRLRKMEKAALSRAVPVENVKNATDGSTLRGGHRIEVKREEQLDPGIGLARLVKCFGMANGNMDRAARLAVSRYGENSKAFGTLKALSDRGFNSLEKAEVPAGATVANNWAEDLVGDTTSAFADFVEYLRPQTILGKFGTNGIPSLRRVPFRVPLISQTAGGSGAWVGEGKAKPVTSFDFSRTTLEPLKVANICILTDEVIRDSSPSAEAIVRDQLVQALVGVIDTDFVAVANNGTANVKPASITNAAPNGASSGSDAEGVRDDIRSLLGEYIAANNPPSTGVLIMRSDTALAISMMVNALGQTEFNGIGMGGGTLLGIPVITSQYVESGIVIMANASDIYLADDGGFRLDMSREATVEMLDGSLAGDSIAVVPGTAASTVSLWQTNSVGFLAERTLNWAARRASAVAYLSGVAWGGAVNDLS